MMAYRCRVAPELTMREGKDGNIAQTAPRVWARDFGVTHLGLTALPKPGLLSSSTRHQSARLSGAGVASCETPGAAFSPCENLRPLAKPDVPGLSRRSAARLQEGVWGA